MKSITFDRLPVRCFAAGMCMLLTLSATAQESVSATTNGNSNANESRPHDYTYTGGAVGVLTADSTFGNKRGEVNISRLLEGHISGVQFSNGGGRPGASVDMRIRGITNAQNLNEPLILLNGFVYTGSLWNINPHDVDSIIVLKDAQATATYAGRSANGIINIITKKATAGSTEIRLSARTGITTRGIKAPPMMDAAQYYETFWAYLENMFRGSSASPEISRQRASESLVDFLNGHNAYNVPNDQLVDPQTGRIREGASLRYDDRWDKAVERTGIRQDYHFSASTTGDNSSGYIGVGYTKDGGYIRNTNNDRFSMQLNGNKKFKPWIEAGFLAQLNYTSEHLTPNTVQRPDASLTSSRFFEDILLTPRIYPVYKRAADGTYVLDANGNRQYDTSRTSGAGPNPVAELLEGTNRSRKLDWTATPYLRFDIAKQLHIQTTFQINGFQRSYKNLAYVRYRHQDYKGNGSYRMLRQSADWERSIGKHHVNLSAAFENGVLRQDFTELTNIGLPQSDYRSGSKESGTHALRAGLNYSFQQRYELSLGISRESFMTYSPQNRNHTFWHIGANWNIHKEPFLQQARFLNAWLLRVSHGRQGNLPYHFMAGNTAGSVYPEYALHSNAGTSIAMFHNRLNLQVDVYQRQSQYAMLPGMFTPPSPVPVRNRGIEASLGIEWVRKQHLRFQSAFIINHNQNRITEGHSNSNITGDALYTFYLPQWSGLDEQGYPQYRVNDGSGGTTLVTDYDQAHMPENLVKLGSSLPTVTGSMEQTVTYRRFTFSILITYGCKGYLHDNVYQSSMNVLSGDNLHTDLLRAWTPQHPNTEIPALLVRNNYNPNIFREATYFNIRNVYLGYQLPAAVLERAKLKDMSLYLTAENLWLWTKAPGIDPQANFEGRGQFGYVPARTIMLGLRLGL